MEKYPKVLIGKKCYLSPLAEDETRTYYRWVNDRDITDTLLITPPKTLAAEEEWVRQVKDRKNSVIFNIRAEDDKLVGNIGLEDICPVDRNAEFGILIGEKEYWGRGIGTEVTKLALIYGFFYLNLHSIFIEVYSFNKRAVKAYENAGFIRDGKLRDATFYRGKYYDSYFMSVIREEWKIPEYLIDLNRLKEND
ncbi:MAG: GNAT family N-acetyltransferase [Proteobacteria bacterium]|nr:GNAT family N-acetyltransferase [Pseudomonadota bacterium]